MQGSTAEAIAHFEQALALNPTLETAHFNWRNALFGAGDLSGAIARYEAALRLNPGDSDAATNLDIARRRFRGSAAPR
jgi:tetratricopeptide (TPR) repeat protein